MVCKENVVSWFGNLSSYKRIDVMCTLLNMCLPFEVRYLGTYVEDRGKPDYNDLRDTEHHANNATELTELAKLGVTETRTRRKLALYIALLQGSNYASANVLYKCLSNVDIQEVINAHVTTRIVGSNEPQPLEELLLIYTMALNHPAFTYDQKRTFTDIYLKLQQEETRSDQPKSLETFSFRANERLGPDVLDFPTNCQILPAPMQHHYSGDIQMRGNQIVTGVPPGLTMAPPPGLCLPAPDQMPLGNAGNPGHYLHMGYPAVSSMGPWSGQAMMVGNQMMYQSSEMPTYPVSPLVSRQSSPSQSRSPSRSNSPMGRRNTMRSWSTTFDDRTSCQIAQSATNTVTTSISKLSNCQSSSSTASKNCGPPRSAPPSTCASASYLRQNSLDNTSSTTNHQPPPPRLRSSVSGDALRDTISKDVSNMKSNLPDLTIGGLRRMSDDDLRDIGLTPNAVGQLRNIVRSQTANGLSLPTGDRQVENSGNFSHQSVTEQSENETAKSGDASSESLNPKVPPQLQDLHQPMHHHPISGIRRYAAVPPSLESPAQMTMYSQPPPMFATQNPCYACLTVPAAGMQNRYPRCNAQHMYCLAQLQALKLDSDNNRYCSQSSSSDSTGSRSPPETPPAAPWTNSTSSTPTAENCTTPGAPTSEHIPSSSCNTAPYSTVVSVAHPNPPTSIQLSTHERPRSTKKHQGNIMRHRTQMMNGSGNGGAVLSNTPHCVSAFPGPTSHPQMAFLPHAHFSTIRPNSGIYSSGFSPSLYSRTVYPPSYQPNGEIMYPYPGGAAGGTPPPPPPPPPATVTASVGVAPSQAYLSTPVVNYTPTPTVQQTKISCYNCGSSSHLASDCKDQTMEDLTKRAQYRLDYTVSKQPGDSSQTDE